MEFGDRTGDPLNDELKASFHEFAKRYHPDLLRSNGVPEEMIKVATEKMAQINAAWEDIRRSRGRLWQLRRNSESKEIFRLSLGFL